MICTVVVTKEKELLGFCVFCFWLLSGCCLMSSGEFVEAVDFCSCVRIVFGSCGFAQL